jgi:ferredoxin-NADP reductase
VAELLTLRVSGVIKATPWTRIVRVALDSQAFPYRAGQAAALGLHGQPLRRPYSMAAAPEDATAQGCLEFLVKVDAHGWAGRHLEGLRRGAPVDVEGPFGGFYFPEDPVETRFLFIAGGTGIAPLRAMIRHALLSERDGHLALLYSARSPIDFAYASELRGLARRSRLKLVLTATREAPHQWAGERGRITLSRLRPLVTDPATLCFVCGPPALIEEVPPMLGKLGVAPARIRLEEW